MVIVIFIILIASLYRALIIPGNDGVTANFSPLWAIALFAGAQIASEKLRYLIPLLVLLLSDIFLNIKYPNESGSALFYPGWIWVYGSIVISVYIGSVSYTHLTLPTILRV